LRCKAIHTTTFVKCARSVFSLIRFLRTNSDAFERLLAMRRPIFPKVLHRRQKMTLTSSGHAVRDSKSSVAMLPLAAWRSMENLDGTV
jgi:hypothetical protein